MATGVGRAVVHVCSQAIRISSSSRPTASVRRRTRTFMLQQSAGPGTVPNVVGFTQAAAGTTLTGAGFATGNVTQIYNPAPAGQVIAQAPTAGTSVLLGSLVDLSVSQGPMPVAVPFLVGKPLQVANTELKGLGFTVIVILVPSATNPVGEVLAQSPAFGTVLPPTTANPITLTVSAGPAPQFANINHIDVKPATTAHLVGENAPFTATAIYNNGTSADFTLAVTWASSVQGVATIDVTGIAHAVGPGSTTITAKVGGFTGQAALNVAAFVAGDGVAPVAAITAPASGGTVTAPTQVVGTATDANFLRYELAFAPAGDVAYTLIGEGTTAGHERCPRCLRSYCTHQRPVHVALDGLRSWRQSNRFDEHRTGPRQHESGAVHADLPGSRHPALGNPHHDQPYLRQPR